MDEDFEWISYRMTRIGCIEQGRESRGRESVRSVEGLSTGAVLVVEKGNKHSPQVVDLATMWAEMPLAYVADARKEITPPALDVRGVIISTQGATKVRKDVEEAITKESNLC